MRQRHEAIRQLAASGMSLSAIARFARLIRRAGPAGPAGPQAPRTAATPTERRERLARLGQWLADATHATQSGVTELQAFATKLRQALAAVEAALTLPYSQGQTEGQITRLKALKRQMFGRASFDLLRKRFLATTPTAASN